MFMFALDSTLKFENVNFPCGASSGTNKNQHTYRLRSSVQCTLYNDITIFDSKKSDLLDEHLQGL